MDVTKENIIDWLEAVKDPEIPVLSLIDLGVVTDIDINEHRVKITITPTFVGCPAIDYMKQDIIDTLNSYGIDHVDVDVSLKESWNSNKITEKGRAALKSFGLAPPRKHDLIVDIDLLTHIECPVCGSINTILKSPFGSTACRAIHYCNDCKEAFEQFKPV